MEMYLPGKFSSSDQQFQKKGQMLPGKKFQLLIECDLWFVGYLLHLGLICFVNSWTVRNFTECRLLLQIVPHVSTTWRTPTPLALSYSSQVPRVTLLPLETFKRFSFSCFGS